MLFEINTYIVSNTSFNSDSSSKPYRIIQWSCDKRGNTGGSSYIKFFEPRRREYRRCREWLGYNRQRGSIEGFGRASRGVIDLAETLTD